MEKVPQIARATIDVTLPANTSEIDIGWSGIGAPRVIPPIYDITDGANPGALVHTSPRNLEPYVDSVGVEGRIFYSTKRHSAEKTYRLIIVPEYEDLVDDTDEPLYIPEAFMDVYIYGGAIRLQDEEPEEIPTSWASQYNECLQDLLNHFRRQHKLNQARYGERYIVARRSGARSNHVR